jgi:hypothetical protein
MSGITALLQLVVNRKQNPADVRALNKQGAVTLPARA